jgi:hypothetical protein
MTSTSPLAAGAPPVTCVVLAYNKGRYLDEALRSVLAQTYPAEALDIVVVDDGSTDDTPERLAAYGDRIRVVRKPNGGVSSAFAAALPLVGGRYLALLDADDVWAPTKVAEQVAVLEARPEVALVYTDMEIVDEATRPVHRSYYELHRIAPRAGRVLGALLEANFVGASLMVRTSLRSLYDPVHPTAPYQDWWVGVRAAEGGEVAYLPRALYRYRLHATNQHLGRDAETLLRHRLSEVPFRRWLLATADLAAVSTAEVLTAYAALEDGAYAASAGLGLPLDEVLAVTSADRAAAAALVRRSQVEAGRSDHQAALRTLVRALATDPSDASIRASLGPLIELAARPDPMAEALAEARAFVVVALADEVIARPDLLTAFAATFSGRDDVTLVIHPPADGSAVDLDALAAAAEAAGLTAEGAADVIALELETAGHPDLALGGRAAALLTARTPGAAAVPAYAPADLAALRQRALARAAA